MTDSWLSIGVTIPNTSVSSTWFPTGRKLGRVGFMCATGPRTIATRLCGEVAERVRADVFARTLNVSSRRPNDSTWARPTKGRAGLPRRQTPDLQAMHGQHSARKYWLGAVQGCMLAITFSWRGGRGVECTGLESWC